MKAVQKIKRHGYHLMSLASLGMLCVLLIMIWTMSIPFLPDWRLESELLDQTFGMVGASGQMLSATSKYLLVLSAVISGLAFLWPLFMLRRLGKSLYRQEALNVSTAEAFRHLAHSIVGNFLLRITATIVIAVAADDSDIEQRLTISFNSVYVLLITCLCLYSVSYLVRIGSDALNDARSIV